MDHLPHSELTYIDDPSGLGRDAGIDDVEITRKRDTNDLFARPGVTDLVIRDRR